MTTRPTAKWRERFQEEHARLAAGTLQAGDAYAIHLWPIDFTDAVDAALEKFEQDVLRLDNPTDAEVFIAVERVVRTLNSINDKHGRIETGEREELCEYISLVLEEAGIDTRELAARRRIGVHELTDARHVAGAGGRHRLDLGVRSRRLGRADRRR